MGLYERVYIRQSRLGGVGAVRVWSFTTWLIVINIAVFVVDGFLGRFQRERAWNGETSFYEWGMRMPPLMEWGNFSIGKAIMQGQVWRLITFQFLHDGIWHLAFNMIALWLLGPVVELTLGFRRYAFFYLMCGMAGAAAFAGLWGLGIVFPGGGGAAGDAGVQHEYAPCGGVGGDIWGAFGGGVSVARADDLHLFF